MEAGRGRAHDNSFILHRGEIGEAKKEACVMRTERAGGRRLMTDWGHAPDGHREGALPKWVSILVDEYPHDECT